MGLDTFDHLKFLIVMLINIGILIKTNTASNEVYEQENNIQCSVCPVSKENGKICSSHGECDCSHGFCNCLPGWVSSSCEYSLSSLTCENLRNCVQCKAYGTGPYSDDNGCDIFCKDYPPVIQEKEVYAKRSDVLCSFLDSDVNNSTKDCRYFFKIANLPQKISSRNPEWKSRMNYQNSDVFIVAKSSMDCESKNIKEYIPHLENTAVNNKNIIFSSHQIMEQIRNEEKKQRVWDYATPTILLIFIALPTITCILSFISNLTKLPCGLCNMFRRPSAGYLRNVRSYPGNLQDVEGSEI